MMGQGAVHSGDRRGRIPGARVVQNIRAQGCQAVIVPRGWEFDLWDKAAIFRIDLPHGRAQKIMAVPKQEAGETVPSGWNRWLARYPRLGAQPAPSLLSTADQLNALLRPAA
jgi:hypothetical protein